MLAAVRMGVIRAVGRAMVALALGAGLAACSGSSAPTFRVGGQVVAGPARVLADATSMFASAAAAKHATLIRQSRCWFSLASGVDVSQIRCGPVAFSGDPAGGHWQTYTIAVHNGREGVTAGPTGQRLGDGERLVDAAGHGARLASRPPGQVLADGSFAELSSAGLPLAQPADGRLRTYGIVAQVTGVGVAYAAGPPDHLVVAAPSHRLVVATFDVSKDDKAPVPKDYHLDAVVAGTRISLGPIFPTADPTHTIALSLPDGATQATLELSAQGVTQTFDLLAGSRSGPQPVALYRDPASTYLTVKPSVSATVTASGGRLDKPATITSTLTDATLSYFSPDDNPAAVTDPTQAYLSVNFANTISVSNLFGGFQPIPTGNVALVLPDGPHVPVEDRKGGSDWLDGTYVWTVPANLTAAKIVVTPPNPIQSNQDNLTLTGGPLSFDLNLPALPPAPAAGAAAPPVPAGVLADELATPSPAAAIRRHDMTVTLVVLAVAALGAAALAVVVRVRRRRVHQRAVADRWSSVLYHEPAPPPSDGESAAVSSPTVERSPSAPPPAAQPTSNTPVTRERTLLTGEADRPAPDLADEQNDPRRLPEWAPPGSLLVQILGPLDVLGWLEPSERKKLTEILIYLTLHRSRPVPSDDLRAALWPLTGDSLDGEAAAKTLITYMSYLRKAAGPDHVPDAHGNDGYTVAATVTSDWERFQALAARANRLPADRARPLLADALSLVRGEPFSGRPPGSYRWVDLENLAEPIVKQIADTAHRLFELALAADDLAQADHASKQGIKAAPKHEQLHIDRLDIAHANKDRAALDAAHQHAKAHLDTGTASRITDHYRQLRNRFDSHTH